MGKTSTLTIADLDGEYDITYQTKGPTVPNFVWFDHTTAVGTVSNGKMTGTDESGCYWDAAIELLPDGQGVAFSASVDPSKAGPTTFVMDKNGTPTKVRQQYAGVLNITAIGENVTIYGTVKHGTINIEINLKRK